MNFSKKLNQKTFWEGEGLLQKDLRAWTIHIGAADGLAGCVRPVDLARTAVQVNTSRQLNKRLAIFWQTTLLDMNCCSDQNHSLTKQKTCNLETIILKGAQVWDFRPLGFSWFLLHKDCLGWWLWG